MVQRFETDGTYGKYGEFAPRLCAVTREALQSGAYTYALDGEHYISVNPLETGGVNAAFKRELLERIAPKPVKSTSQRKVASELGE